METRVEIMILEEEKPNFNTIFNTPRRSSPALKRERLGHSTCKTSLAISKFNPLQNFIKEIRLKINDTQKSNSINPLQFYKRNPFKNEPHEKIKF